MFQCKFNTVTMIIQINLPLSFKFLVIFSLFILCKYTLKLFTVNFPSKYQNVKKNCSRQLWYLMCTFVHLLCMIQYLEIQQSTDL
jgi:hypothetical protein